MSNIVEANREVALQSMLDVELRPVMPELDFSIVGADKIPLSSLTPLGIAFQPLTAAIQFVFGEGGGSGIYFVDTMGKQMHQFKGSKDYLGSLKAVDGTVGGGQAHMIPLPCDPTMLAVAAAVVAIEKKLGAIIEVQEDIMDFLEEKERAKLIGSLNTLSEILTDYKYNWNNDNYKRINQAVVKQIKREADSSIVLYRKQIAKKLKKRTAIHHKLNINAVLEDLQAGLCDYQRALYLYAFSTFLEVMLQENFSEGYLSSVEQRLLDYSVQYREVYTQCYNLMEEYVNSSIEAGVMDGLAAATKFAGNVIAKVPVISRSQLDENLIESSEKLDRHNDQRAIIALEGIMQNRMSVVQPFVDNLRAVRELYNTPVMYFFDSENIYVKRISG